MKKNLIHIINKFKNWHIFVKIFENENYRCNNARNMGGN